MCPPTTSDAPLRYADGPMAVDPADVAVGERVRAVLERLAVPYEIITIDPDFADTAQFCAKYGVPLDQSANTIIVASKKEPKQYCACLVLATTRLDVNHGVRKLMGLAREAFGGAYRPDGGSIGGPRKDNSPVFRERYARARLTDQQAAAITWLAAQPNGPAKILVISEDWSSDCRRDLPMLARLAEAGGLELRIFNRDGKKILGTRRPDPAVYPDANHDLMLEFMNRKND